MRRRPRRSSPRRRCTDVLARPAEVVGRCRDRPDALGRVEHLGAALRQDGDRGGGRGRRRGDRRRRRAGAAVVEAVGAGRRGGHGALAGAEVLGLGSGSRTRRRSARWARGAGLGGASTPRKRSRAPERSNLGLACRPGAGPSREARSGSPADAAPSPRGARTHVGHPDPASSVRTSGRASVPCRSRRAIADRPDRVSSAWQGQQLVGPRVRLAVEEPIDDLAEDRLVRRRPTEQRHRRPKLHRVDRAEDAPRPTGPGRRGQRRAFDAGAARGRGAPRTPAPRRATRSRSAATSGLRPRPAICGNTNHIQWPDLCPRRKLREHAVVHAGLRLDEPLEVVAATRSARHRAQPPLPPAPAAGIRGTPRWCRGCPSCP